MQDFNFISRHGFLVARDFCNGRPKRRCPAARAFKSSVFSMVSTVTDVTSNLSNLKVSAGAADVGKENSVRSARSGRGSAAARAWQQAARLPVRP